ncbi:PBS lyase HEAT domain protein repeat-containing protein [Candidatus Gastranaerophilus sp. (ex Termes propinquus)]|nr:PBS lyase HEAT domain protein repeat-containing protein [Candidatus Gastranaerophilus sp. (ex Termes propinquus)]
MYTMDLGTKNANNLISKDSNVAKCAAESILNSGDVETFEKLAQNSEFLFDFIKQKIVEKLLNATNSKNYKNILKFTHLYSADFEDFIVQGLVRHASEELTDTMLELFEVGSDEQKAYCAAYFSSVKDPLCLEYLNKYALSDFDPLSANCAKALFGFDDRGLYGEMIEKLKSDAEDFEKFDALNFLVSFGDKAAFEPLVDFMRTCAFAPNAAASILSLKSLFEIVEEGQEGVAVEIFDNLLSAYPEILSVSTVADFEVFDFIKYLANSSPEGTASSKSLKDRIILKAKIKFELLSQNDIYTFDLDKNTKALIAEIYSFLNTLKTDCKNALENELLQNEMRAQEALDVILELNLSEFAQNIAELTKSAEITQSMLCECVKTLKHLGKIDLVDKNQITTNAKDENILALLGSYF